MEEEGESTKACPFQIGYDCREICAWRQSNGRCVMLNIADALDHIVRCAVAGEGIPAPRSGGEASA
jgi:hypothetical protein